MISHSGSRALRFKCCILAAVTVAVLAVTSALAADVKPLVIAEKSRVVASKDTYIILVLDLKRNLDDLTKAGSAAADTIMATAATYAREYLAKSEFSQTPKAVVYLITIDSMDEYNHANFDGMKRFGTLTFERKGADVVMTDNKLSFKP
jgi:hypothetical protein